MKVAASWTTLLLAAAIPAAAAVDERSVLLDFFETTGGHAWSENYGWGDRNIDICEWHGVVCQGEDENLVNRRQMQESDKVVGLKLPGNLMTGRTPASLWSLPSLTSVDFSNNKHLDVSFVGLQDDNASPIQTIKVQNTATTSIAGLSAAANTLETLHLAKNNLDSKIPGDMYALTKLESLRVSECGLLGNMPEDIRRLSMLRELDMEKNDLTGTLPEGLGRLVHLRKLDLGFNQFHGTLPDYVNNYLMLKEFRVLSNDFTGTIPSFNQSPDIEKLYFNANSFSGGLPENFLAATRSSFQSQEIHVNMASNELSGTIPVSLDDLEDLNMVWFLGDNEWTDFPDEVCDNVNWNQGAIADYGCDGFLCPLGSFSRHGFQTPDTACQPCPSIEFYGATGCFDKDDRSMLVELYVELKGENWFNNENWMNDDDVCKWYGIECWDIDDAKTGRVRKISLPNNGLVGDVPETIFGMHHLTTLDLSRNDIVLPFTSIDQSSHMFSINVAKTKTKDFTGIDGANQHFRELFADQTPISGSIPSEILRITSLKTLSLQECDLSGGIPDGIFDMANLERLYLSDNNLQGVIPDRWDELEGLKVLALAKNQLEGRIPPSFDRAISLTAVSVRDQVTKGGGLTGQVQPLATTSTIRTLHLGGNKIEGELPESLLASVEMDLPIVVDLSDNLITGKVHGEYSRFKRMDIYLQGNFITKVDNELCSLSEWMSGTVSEYGCDAILCPAGTSGGRHRFINGACQPCEDVGIFGSSLFGQMTCSNASSELTERDILELLHNQCGGPEWRVSTSWMSQDNICEWYGVDCDENGSVTSIHLGENQLEGNVPTEIFMLPNLLHLKLYNNNIGFSFNGIQNADKLVTLGLDNTGLSSLKGIGRARSLVELNVASNNLSGPIPDELSRLVNLESFDISRNKISGYLPYWLRSLVSMTTFTASHNTIRGPLYDFAALKDLVYVDLSHNQLTGNIPETLFAGSPETRKIVADFSCNSLTGEIPGELSRLDRLAMQVASNRITGLDESLCTVGGWNDFDVQRFGCNAILCPAGTWNRLGRQSTERTPCESCSKAKYMGSTTCGRSSATTAFQPGLWVLSILSALVLAW